jgi:ABC-2 type transport system permease protein
MSQLSGLYAIWLREVKVFFREYSRLIGSVLTPLLWLVVVGKGIGASIEDEASFGGYGYDTFIFPGILCMTVLFQSVFYGLYIVWDRKIDFLKEVLAAPLHRSTIFLGKVLGGVTDSMVQVTIIVILGYFIFPELRENYTVQSLAIVYLFMFLLAVTMTSIGLIIGSRMESPEGFSLIVSLVVFPMYFLSGALFLKKNLVNEAPYLYWATVANPVSYAVDAIRYTLLPVEAFNEFGLARDLAVLGGFCIALLGVGTLAFRTMRL